MTGQVHCWGTTSHRLAIGVFGFVVSFVGIRAKYYAVLRRFGSISGSCGVPSCPAQWIFVNNGLCDCRVLLVDTITRRRVSWAGGRVAVRVHQHFTEIFCDARLSRKISVKQRCTMTLLLGSWLLVQGREECCITCLYNNVKFSQTR